MLYLVSIGMDCVISEPCYKGAILQKNLENDHAMIIFL